MVLGGVALGATVSLVANVRAEREQFEERISSEIDALLAASTPADPGVITGADLEGLPEPVRRWLRHSGVVGRARPRTVRLRQAGEIQLGGSWRPFTAEQYYTTDPPGFVWSVRVPMFPGVTAIGRDRYADGRGSIDVRLGGIVPVAREAGPEMDRGALLRYLDEIMWFPAGALSPYIAWEPIDGVSARATMTWGGISAPAVFAFDREGRFTDLVAERHDRETGRAVTWSTPATEYGGFDGVRIPVAGEGVYARASGDEPYIRVRITDLEYDRPERYRHGAVPGAAESG
jgi:hypothetical protein